MKKTLLILAFLISLQIKAQEDKTVTLTVSGTGKTLEEAKTNALRSAIEQAFGAFISSKTEILDDNLVKDEVVSVSNGNVQKYDIISQVEIPNSGYAMTLNATVSISKLTSFAQSKGVSIEVKGGLFAANIIQQELNEKAELISLQNILNTSNELLKKSFDYSIENIGNPTLYNVSYEIPLIVTVKINKNFVEFRKYFIESLSGLTMNESEISSYEEINKPIGQMIIRRDTLTFQKNLMKKVYRNVGEEWKVDIEDFDENSEKIFFTWGGQWYGNIEKFAPIAYFNAKTNKELDNIFEIHTKKDLKNIFRNGWLGSAQKPESMIIYKVNKNDFGYSKIFFRNNQSLDIINNFLNNMNNYILNFELNDDFKTILGKNLIVTGNYEGNKSINLRKANAYLNLIVGEKPPGYYNLRTFKTFGTVALLGCDKLGELKYVTKDNANYFFNSNNCVGRKGFNSINNFLELSENIKYFPNILSISPLKLFSKNMILQLSYFNEKSEIIKIAFIDTKSLEEMKQLTEYKIKPID